MLFYCWILKKHIHLINTLDKLKMITILLSSVVHKTVGNNEQLG